MQAGTRVLRPSPADRLRIGSRPSATMTPPKFLSPQEFSELSGLSIATVRRYVAPAGCRRSSQPGRADAS